MDTRRIDDSVALPCDELLMARVAKLCVAEVATQVHWRIGLLGGSGRPYRLFELGDFGQYLELVEILRSLGFCHALPCDGCDEVFVRLWPPSTSSEPLPDAPADGRASFVSGEPTFR